MKKYISIFIIAVMLLSTFGMSTAALAAGTVNLSMDPDSVEALEGETVNFTATVFNDLGEELTDYRVKLGTTTTFGGGVPLAVGDSGDIDVSFVATAEYIDAPHLTFSVEYQTASTPSWTTGEAATVSIDKKELSVEMAASASVSQDIVKIGDQITFTFEIENQGEATLENVVIKADNLNDGGALNNEPLTIEAGSAPAKVTYVHTVTAVVTIKPVISYSANGEEQSPYATNEIELTEESRKVDAVLTVDNTTPDIDEDVTFTLTLLNGGTVPYKNIKVTYNGIDKGFSSNKLNPGEEYSDTYTMSFSKSEDVYFSITLEDHKGATRPVTSNTIEIKLPVDTETLMAGVTMTIDPDVSDLPSAGTVNFSGNVYNTSDYTISNVTLSESVLGQVFGPVSIPSKGQEAFSYKANIDETTTYAFVLTYKDEDGKVYTKDADPITVTITPVAEETDFDDAADLTLETGSGNSLTTLVVLGIVLFVLIIGVGATLLVLWRKGKRPHRASSKIAGRGKKAPAAKKTSIKKKPKSTKSYKDRNSF